MLASILTSLSIPMLMRCSSSRLEISKTVAISVFKAVDPSWQLSNTHAFIWRSIWLISSIRSSTPFLKVRFLKMSF